jgi:hypothetical protein
VAGYIAEIFITGSISCGFGCSSNHCPNASRCEVDKRFDVVEIVVSGELVEISLCFGW